MKRLNMAFALVAVASASSVDYSQNGHNWNSLLCVNGTRQSPIDISSSQAIPNSLVNFWWNYNAIEDVSLVQADNNGSLYIDMSQSSKLNYIDFWNEYGEHFLYYLSEIRWKVGSEHTIDNTHYSAELQVVHTQFGTNRQLILSVLFDVNLDILKKLTKPKTCFIDSFEFTNFKQDQGQLVIPLIEFLQYIPQDFYYYRGSINAPPCSESVSWFVYKTPQIITQDQLAQLKALVNLPKGNNRDIQAKEQPGSVQRVVLLPVHPN